MDSYSNRFLSGFLLGLVLTDGYLKERFCFNTTSPKLAENVKYILGRLGYKANLYKHRRGEQGWKDLCMISLTKCDSRSLLGILNKELEKVGYNKGFKIIKGY
ncbi:MAG: LAGLIDADG family homing endonuclease [Candidatus Woesearchaeota archaeon]|nr:LAGLIDADG family homing endonuclease [Candidatus Woesearchaeota archaeon]MDP7506205.1 LAGLIDADG family homing endonuclease [Candidatus Woesearchaeota archaeon]MDP7610548.1 LAGLIDADG family homing endonuclease [Candidatus Woesearchaeota archaeon]